VRLRKVLQANAREKFSQSVVAAQQPLVLQDFNGNSMVGMEAYTGEIQNGQPSKSFFPSNVRVTPGIDCLQFDSRFFERLIDHDAMAKGEP
jgi:hypothetical protein